MRSTLVAPACWWSSHTTDCNVLLQILVPESLTDQTAAQIFVSLSSLLLTTACHALQSETSMTGIRNAVVPSLRCTQMDMICMTDLLCCLSCACHDCVSFYILPGHSSWGQCQMMLCFMHKILCNACHTLRMLLPVYRSTP